MVAAREARPVEARETSPMSAVVRREDQAANDDEIFPFGGGNINIGSGGNNVGNVAGNNWGGNGWNNWNNGWGNWNNNNCGSVNCWSLGKYSFLLGGFVKGSRWLTGGI